MNITPNITPKTKLYGVIGNPIAHSKSPLIFNQLFSRLDVDAVYHYWKIADNADLEKFVKNMKTFNLQGVSVTLPFKKQVIPYLDGLDDLAKKLECINTVTVRDEKLIGYNFDGVGAISPLTKLKDWKNLNYLFIGLGGAAEGIILTLIHLYDMEGKLAVAMRNISKGDEFKKKVNSLNNKNINFEVHDLEKVAKPDSAQPSFLNEFDVIINTTPLGMSIAADPDNVKQSPVAQENLSPKHLVYDIVYNPLETTLIKDALSQGARVIYGHTMFLEQARRQFNLWTGKEVSLEMMQEVFFKA